MIKTLAFASLFAAASGQHVPPHRIPASPHHSPLTPITPAPAPPTPQPAPPTPKPAPPTPAGNSKYKVSDITHEPGFGVGEITMLPAQKGGAWAPNNVAIPLGDRQRPRQHEGATQPHQHAHGEPIADGCHGASACNT